MQLPSTTHPLPWLIHFNLKQAQSCVFGFGVIGALALSKVIYRLAPIPGLHRYDFILLCCVAIQTAMLLGKLETRDELKVICVFHLLGLTMEIYKVSIGSWSYPEEAWTKVAGVPLYSGFMYASVASYMTQAWRRFNLEIVRWPPSVPVAILSGAVYLNFFTNRYVYDVRWILILLITGLFWKTGVNFSVGNWRGRMPMLLSFVLIGAAIWVGENIATRLGAWQYPNQADGWEMVHLQKVTSWALLVIISFITVAQLKRVKSGS